MKKKNLSFPHRFFEKKAWLNNNLVCGIDEVGRGCLAGPLVTAAAILPKDSHHPLLKDSKILNRQQREKAFNWLTKTCYYSVAIASHHTIDTLNIYQSTLQTMKKSFIQLIEKNLDVFHKLKYVVIDAMPLQLPNSYIHDNLEIYHFNYGESISPSIAAASIIAKITRDKLMEDIENYFPAFNFAQHKGYGTKEHINSIKINKPSLIHRQSFLSNLLESVTNNEKQQTLF